LSHSASSRALAIAVVSLICPAAVTARAEGAPAIRAQATVPSSIVIGFVGGFVRHDNPHHGPVQLAQRIQRGFPKDTYVEVFENRHRKNAFNAIAHLLDVNRDGVLSDDEKTRAHIVLFGHSWGAAAAVLLARDLQRNGIPVRLTVQVDSVAKLWQNDSVIPANVAEAVNFYQTHGLIHGRKRITAADPSRTQILGNYLVDYRKTPIQCPAGASWFDHVTPSHAKSECDPHIWSQIEDLVRQHLAPQPSTVAAHLQP
jgi:pimeloyl-ACP methyl ester carboxylesterase